MTRDEEHNRLILDFQKTFDTDSGKRVLEALRKRARMDVSVIPLDHNGHIDIYQVMRNEGQKAMMIHIDYMLTKSINKERQEEARS